MQAKYATQSSRLFNVLGLLLDHMRITAAMGSRRNDLHAVCTAGSKLTPLEVSNL